MTTPGDVLISSDWSVAPIEHAEAVHLIQIWHYSASAPNTSTARHGLWSLDLLGAHGAALWLPPTPPCARKVGGDDWRGVLSLSRLVVSPEAPANAASFLLGRSMRLIDRDRWPVLVTFADTRLSHTGAIYRATNWIEDGEVPAGDVWIGPDGQQRGRKRGGRNLTVAEMRALGFERAPAAPKIRFRHDVRQATA